MEIGFCAFGLTRLTPDTVVFPAGAKVTESAFVKRKNKV